MKAMTRDEVFAAGLNGSAEITDLREAKKFNIRISIAPNYHHSDFEPETRADAVTMFSLVNNAWSWSKPGGIRPAIMRWRSKAIDHITVCSYHLMPHDINLYGKWSYNVMSDSFFSKNRQGSHFCLHYTDSLKLRALGWSQWNQDMHDAVNEAAGIGGKPQAQTTPPVKQPIEIALNARYIVNTVSGSLNCRDGAGLSFRVIGAFQKSEIITAAKRSGDWAYVTNGKLKGWSSMEYLGAPPASDVSGNYILYTVVEGDILGRIAIAHETTVEKIAGINGISNPNTIFPGQVLKIA